MEQVTRTGLAVWDAISVGERQCIQWRFPHRSFYVERLASEWHVLSLPAHEPEVLESCAIIDRSEKPDSMAWRHYLLKNADRLQPLPMLPDRPLVVRPDRPLTILAGQNALFHLEIPLWFRLTAAGEKPLRMFEEALIVPIPTWFGDPVNGELCYTLTTRLHQSLDSLDPSAHRAVCPVAIANDSDTDLPFEKICLHVENLSVFRAPAQLWTNRINVLFRGPEQATQINIAQGVPDVGGDIRLATTARQPTEGWSFRRTFSIFKDFAGT
jgi:hypothetical protein